MTTAEVQASKAGKDTLLGEPAGDLRLKISWDSGRSGEVVDVAARKATIGSDAGNTIQLAGADVAPLECLLLRGAERNVVRWYNSIAAATGEDVFEDEVLTAGDQLQIGRADLEILGEASATEDESSLLAEPDVTAYATRLETVERQLQELQRNAGADSRATLASQQELQFASSRQAELTEQLELVQRHHDEELLRWNTERHDLEQLVAVQSTSVTDLRAEIETLQEELRSIRAEQAELKPVAEEQADRLASATLELREREQADLEREQAWQREQKDLETQLEQTQQQLAEFKDELTETRRQTAELQSTHEGAQGRIEELQESIEDLTTQLAEKEASFAATRDEWEHERQQTEQQLAELTSRKRATGADDEPCDTAATHPQQFEQPEEHPTQLAVERHDLTDAPDTTTEDLHAQLERLRSQACNDAGPGQAEAGPSGTLPHGGGGGEQAASASEMESDWTGAASPMDRFLSASSLLDDEDSGLENGGLHRGFAATETLEECSTHSPEAASFNADYGTNTSYDAGDPASDVNAALEGLAGDYGRSVTPDGASEQTAWDKSSEEPPVSTADVLARLGKAGAWSEGGDDQDEPSSLAPGEAEDFNSDRGQQSATATGLHASAGMNAPASLAEAYGNPGASSEDDEDESIEDYMTRLLNRSRGGDETATAPATETVARTPVHEERATEAPTTVPDEPVATIDMDEYKPSRQAPEAAVKLDAMRELANETRRTAIASHAKRNWSSVMKLKLLVSIFAGLAVTASIIFFWGNPIAMISGVVAGLAVLGYWAWLVKTYRKLLIESLMLDTQHQSTE